MQQPVSERLKVVRNKLGLTQKRFANGIGVSGPAITQYELGHNNPSSDVLTKISHAYSVNLQWLLTGEGEMFTDSGPPATVASQSDTPIHYHKRGPKAQPADMPVVHIHHPTPTSAVIADLERLAALLAKGLLTQEEFDTLKARLLQPNP